MVKSSVQNAEDVFRLIGIYKLGDSTEQATKRWIRANASHQDMELMPQIRRTDDLSQLPFWERQLYSLAYAGDALFLGFTSSSSNIPQAKYFYHTRGDYRFKELAASALSLSNYELTREVDRKTVIGEIIKIAESEYQHGLARIIIPALVAKVTSEQLGARSDGISLAQQVVESRCDNENFLKSEKFRNYRDAKDKASFLTARDIVKCADHPKLLEYVPVVTKIEVLANHPTSVRPHGQSIKDSIAAADLTVVSFKAVCAIAEKRSNLGEATEEVELWADLARERDVKLPDTPEIREACAKILTDRHLNKRQSFEREYTVDRLEKLHANFRAIGVTIPDFDRQRFLLGGMTLEHALDLTEAITTASSFYRKPQIKQFTPEKPKVQNISP